MVCLSICLFGSIGLKKKIRVPGKKQNPIPVKYSDLGFFRNLYFGCPIDPDTDGGKAAAKPLEVTERWLSWNSFEWSL